MPDYERLTFELPVDQEDLLSVELWSLGAVGLELEDGGGPLRIDAYFESSSAPALSPQPAGWTRRGIRLTSRRSVESRDWLAAYRARAVPLDVGPRLRLDPGDPPVGGEEGDRLLLRVPARRAFGTGSHESTRLLLEWLQEVDLADKRILDLGTGSGVLALAALRLGAGWVVGLDVDPVAACVARETAALNRIRLPLVAGPVGCLAGAGFDLLMANILPFEWLSELPEVTRHLVPGAEALVSGASVDDVGMLAERLGEAGWRVVEERSAGEWRALGARLP